MSDGAIYILTFASALGCGLVAGVFFAFSAFVMKALARIPQAQGIVAMQSINLVVLNPVFLGVFLGAAVGCAALAIFAMAEWNRPGATPMLTGSALYLVGTVLVTRIFNVPRNEALAVLDPSSEEASIAWMMYLRTWTAWNHVRTAASLVSAALLTLAIA